ATSGRMIFSQKTTREWMLSRTLAPSDDACAQAVVDVEDTGRATVAGGFDDEEAGDLAVPHDRDGAFGDLVGRDGARTIRHHLARRPVEKARQMAAQVAVGDDADQPARRVGDTHHAEARSEERRVGKA